MVHDVRRAIRRLRVWRLAALAAVGHGVLAGTALAGLSIGGYMAHSRDDIPASFSTLTGNDVTANVTLPFAVAIDGTSYTLLTISTNGWIEFGGNTSANSDPTNDCLPTAAHTNPFLAPYWDDLRTINTNIRYGTVGSAGGRVFIADFALENNFGANHDVNMQVQIHERSNVITIKYFATEAESDGQTATIGFQGAGGASATAHSITCNGKVLDDNATNEGWSVMLGTASTPTTLHGVMAHSRDDLPAAFGTLTGNDATVNATLPFAVVIDGTSYTTVTISTNGWLEFGGNTSGNSDPTNDCLPTSAHTNPFLAAYWDDLQTITGSATNHIRYGTVGSAGGRTFVADFRAENAFGSNHNVDMQVQVHEGSNLIIVKFHGNESESNGQTATIGFQSAGGASAKVYPITCNGKVLDDNVANEGWSIDLTPPDGGALFAFMAHSRDDIPGTFTTVTGDNVIGNVTLPFSVNIEGTSYTTLALSTNGWIEFGGDTSGGSDPTNDCLPTSAHTHPFLAAYWDDLRTLGTAIRYGTVGSSGGRTFIADFEVENNFGSNHNMDFQVQVHERSNLISVKYFGNEVEANGQTATIGFQGAGGAAANAYPVTCNGKVLDDNTTDSEGWAIAPTRICGDGDVDPGEACDLGAANGSSSSCCTATCDLRAAGSTCRSAAGVCDVAETCTGSSPTCLADGKSTAVCRPAADVCDVAETCDGSGNNCPADAAATAGTPCRSAAGACDLVDTCDGTSTACPADQKSTAVCRPATGVCDVAESCDGVANDCPADGFAPATQVCRAAADVCDVAETCTGTGPTCPPDTFAPATQECRAAAGVCDVAETCSGSSPSCPPNAFAPATQQCRAAAGVCDVAEHCTGAGVSCPADAFAPATQECRGAAGACDTAESCTGGGPDCPADAFQPSTVVCRASTGDCDLSELCTGSDADCPADARSPAGTTCRPVAGACDVAETCDGTSAACPPDEFEPSTVVCRPSAGACDLPESCPGNGPSCPSDAKSTSECRPSAGPCDLAESCDGVGNDCPADGVQSPGGTFICRPAAGPCDVAETCDGSGAGCPGDGFQPSTVVCRAAAGSCDLADTCTGSAAGCPADAKSTGVCRPPAGACDVAESCDGVADDCPADAKSTALCRPAAGPCDVSESCDGVGNGCPADAKSTAVCRPAAGPCDVAESCDGVANNCPADTKSTAVCRAAVGACDQAESCDGVGNTCPPDLLKPAGTTCRPAASSCDFSEACTGLLSACPPDLTQPNGTPCNDNSSCTTGDACQGGLCVGTPNLDGCVDDFLCYKAKARAPFTQIPSVHLVDQFEDVNVSVVKPRHLCTPADKNTEGTLDPATHLRSYRIKSLTAHLKRVNIKVTNQLGQLFVDTVRPDLLLVPSAKSLTGLPPAPSNGSHNVDHFKCYKVKVTAGTPKLAKGITVSVADQFTVPAKVLAVRKPRHLCTPVNKNNEGIKNPDAHLLCYLVKPASGQPKHQRRSPVYVNNQFGPGSLATVKEDELCIPSLKNP